MINLLSPLQKPALTGSLKPASLYTDGGSRGNPGIAGAGAVLFDNEQTELWRGGTYCGTNTNNFAEYSGLVLGLTHAIELKITDLGVFMDSKLIIEQMNGHWKVKLANLRPLFEKAKKLAEKFNTLTFTHIRREKNFLADQLANQAMNLKKSF